MQLVRVKELDEDKRYTAEPTEFTPDGQTQPAGSEELTVVNLAEPCGQDGQLPAGTDAVAIDVEGQWVIFVQSVAKQMFPAKILYTYGGGLYRVRPQVPVGETTFADKPGAADINACNLAELDMVDPLGLEADTIVLVAELQTQGDPPTFRYAFDRYVPDEYH
jgi:hypothetical protein